MADTATGSDKPCTVGDVRDHVHAENSPETNRRNAGAWMRWLSDQFNRRKFPEYVEEHRQFTAAHAQSTDALVPSRPRPEHERIRSCSSSN